MKLSFYNENHFVVFTMYARIPISGFMGGFNETTMIPSCIRSPVMKTRNAFSCQNGAAIFIVYARP